MEADGENVIYVQVDEHGRVVNYTTNMPGGEQVILFQEGGEDESQQQQQQQMYQPQQVTGQQILQAPAQGTSQVIHTSAADGTQIIQAPTVSIGADIIHDPSVQAQIMAQASSDAMVIQAPTSSINSASSIIETAFSQATNEGAQAAIIDGQGNRILITDDNQLPVQLMTSSASSAAPIILSSEQAQILIAGAQQQPQPPPQPQRRTKPIQHRTTPTIVKSSRPAGRSLLTQATRNLVAARGAAQVTGSPRVLPAALQPSPAQQLIISAPSQQLATTTVTSVAAARPATAAFTGNIVMDNNLVTVSATQQQGDEQVVRLEEAQELSDQISAEDQISQAERDMLQAAKAEQEKQEDASATQEDMLQIDENPTASDQNAQTAQDGVTQDQSNIPMPEEDILMPMPEQPATDTKPEAAEAQQETVAMPDSEMQAAEDIPVSGTEHAQVILTEPAQVSATDSTPAEISVTLSEVEGTMKPETTENTVQEQQAMEAASTQLNGNIFANEEEEMETDETAIQAVVVTTVPVQPTETEPKDAAPEEKVEAAKPPPQDIGETYAKIMELTEKFDNKYAEMTGKKVSKPEATQSVTSPVQTKPIKKVMITPSKIVPKHDTDSNRDITESDDDFEFKPQGVGRPKKTYEGIASRKKQTSEKDDKDSTLNQSIAERRARRKIKPSARNIDMSDMKDSTEDDTEDEGLIIESDKPAEKRGRGRPRKHPHEPKAGASTIITLPKTAIISPGKAIQVTAAHMSPSRIIHGSPSKTLTETKPITIILPSTTAKTTPVKTLSPAKTATPVREAQNEDAQKRGRGRPRNSETKVLGSVTTAGGSKEQQPDVTSSSDQFSDAPDPVQKSFMANFSLMTAAQRQAREEESKKRRSKRVSLQAQAEAEQKAKEEEEAKEKEQDTEKKTDNIFDIFESNSPKVENEIQSLRDDVDDLKDVNSQLLSKLSSPTEDTDVKSLQAKVRKLQTVNQELKTRLRTYESKSASTKFTERNEIKSLQAKVDKLNTQNVDLKSKVTDLELGRVATPQSVDKKGVMHKLKSPKANRDRAGKMSSHDLEEWAAELQAKQESLEKKDLKQRILDRELDERTAMLKAKEGKLGRITIQHKTKERELQYRETQIERGINQRQSDKSKSDKQLDAREQEVMLREEQLDDAEEDLANFEQSLIEEEKNLESQSELMLKTEQALQSLGAELVKKYDALQNSGHDYSQEKAELENKMAETAANIKAATTPRKRTVPRRSVRTSRSRKVQRAASPASSRGSTRGATPAQSRILLRRDSARSHSSDTKQEEKVETKSRRSVGKPRKYSPSPEPPRAKDSPRSPLSPTASDEFSVNGHTVPKISNTNGEKLTARNRSVQNSAGVTVQRSSRRSKAGLTEIKPKEQAENGDIGEKTKSLDDKEAAMSLKESFGKAVKKSDSSSEKDGAAGKGDDKKSTEETKSTRGSVGKRTRRESSPASAQPAKKRKA